MSTVTVSPLRQRMIEDMNARKLCAGTQRGHIHSCKRCMELCITDCGSNNLLPFLRMLVPYP